MDNQVRSLAVSGVGGGPGTDMDITVAPDLSLFRLDNPWDFFAPTVETGTEQGSLVEVRGAVEPHVGGVKNRSDCGNNRDVIGENREVRYLERLRFHQRQRG